MGKKKLREDLGPKLRNTLAAQPTPKKQWYVTVKEEASGDVVKELGPFADERTAGKAFNGVNINLDHDRFHADIEER